LTEPGAFSKSIAPRSTRTRRTNSSCPDDSQSSLTWSSLQDGLTLFIHTWYLTHFH